MSDSGEQFQIPTFPLGLAIGDADGRVLDRGTVASYDQNSVTGDLPGGLVVDRIEELTRGSSRLDYAVAPQRTRWRDAGKKWMCLRHPRAPKFSHLVVDRIEELTRGSSRLDYAVAPQRTRWRDAGKKWMSLRHPRPAAPTHSK
jgi:hypothetical protein